MSCCCCCSAKKDEAREVGPQALNLKLLFAEMDVLLKNLEIVDMEPICASTTDLAGEQWISKIEVLCMMLLLVCYEFVDAMNQEPSLDKGGEKSDAKENGVAPEDLKSPTEKLAGANGC
ncbi:unnamed protein product [Urochloa humidicola]